MTRTGLFATAYHEAGHAVAAILKRVRFKTVTVEATATTAGHLTFLKPAKSIEHLHARGLVALAGEAAQRRYSVRSVRRYHGGGDREAVVSYALEASGSPAQADLLVRLWDVQACELIEARWSAVQNVAEALLDQVTLSEQDCRELVVNAARGVTSS